MKKLLYLFFLLFVNVNFCSSKDLSDNSIEGLSNFVEGYLLGSGLDKPTFSQTCGNEETEEISAEDFISSFQESLENGPYGEAVDKVTMDSFVLSRVLFEIEELVKKGIGIDETIEIVERVITVDDSAIRVLAFIPCDSLIKQGGKIDRVIEVAKIGVADEDWYVRDSAIKTFKTLVEHGYGFDEAIEAGLKLMTDENGYVRYFAIELFKALVKKDKGITEAMDVVKVNVFHYDSEIGYCARILLEKLIEKGVELDSVIELAKKAIDQKPWTAKSFVVQFYKLLFNENRGLKLSAATSALTYSNWDAPYKLLACLVNAGEAFSEVLDLAREGIKTKDKFLRSGSLYLFEALVKKGQAISESIGVAKHGVKDKDKDVRHSSLSLFMALVDKGQAINEAKEAANFCVSDKDEWNRLLAGQLIKVLK